MFTRGRSALHALIPWQFSAHLHVEQQVVLGFSFEGIDFAQCLRIDLLVESRILLELKVVDRSVPAHWTQLLTCLRLANLPVGPSAISASISRCLST
jgi:GxxExxY protein